MPTYGRPRFVTQAVRYFLREDLAERELVVIDDGPDSVASLLPGDERVRYVRLDRRATIGAKRNVGVEAARGDVLVQWDDDDWHGPGRIRAQAADLLAGRADITFLPQAWLLDARATRFWRDRDPVGAGGTFAFTRDAWRRAGGYDDCSAGEDWAFFHKVVEGGGRAARVEHEGTYVYVRHLVNSFRFDFDPDEGPGPGWAPAHLPSFFPVDDLQFYRSLSQRRLAPAPARRPAPPRPAKAPPVPMAIVHHANQGLVTDGYTDREGLGELLAAFAEVLALHLRHRVPLHLHLSGTLLETIAWHAPEFFGWVRALRDSDLVELIGSTYSQHVMTVASTEHNRRQLEEALALQRAHLGVDAHEITGFWPPERVWDTDALAPLLTDPSLPNGGYRYVLVDDRLAYRTQGGSGPRRSEFDATTPSGGEPSPVVGPTTPRTAPWTVARPFSIAGGGGLVGVPISAHLRYRVPPKAATDWAALETVLEQAAAGGAAAVTVYADDLEKTAAVGPWGPRAWTAEAVAGYARFLEWASERADVRPVLLGDHLRQRPPAASTVVEPGTYHELAHVMGAGEDYRRWWDDPEWRPYRAVMDDAEARLERATPAPSRRLHELGWKQLMACSYEAGWQVPGSDGRYRPAAWVKASAAHARIVRIVEEAMAWASAPPAGPSAVCTDVDGNGQEEVVLANEHLYALVTPRWGGRLVYLFERTGCDAVLVVGNPADDWHLQEDLHRFQEVPANHPGAFCDIGGENEAFSVADLEVGSQRAEARLVRSAGEGLAPCRVTKTFALEAGGRVLGCSYRLPPGRPIQRVELALSPDYLALLRRGRGPLRSLSSAEWRGWRNGTTSAWVRIPPGEPLVWDVPPTPAPGHALLVRVVAYGHAFRLELGTGPPPAAEHPVALPIAATTSAALNGRSRSEPDR